MSILFNIATVDNTLSAPVPVQTKNLRSGSSQSPKDKVQKTVAPPELLTPEHLVNPVVSAPLRVVKQSEAVVEPNPTPAVTDAIAPPETLTSDLPIQWSDPPTTTSSLLEQSEASHQPATTGAIAPAETLTLDQLVQWPDPPTVTPQNHEHPGGED